VFIVKTFCQSKHQFSLSGSFFIYILPLNLKLPYVLIHSAAQSHLVLLYLSSANIWKKGTLQFHSINVDVLELELE